MAFLDWSHQLELGFSEIDEQHRKIVDLINKLHTAMLEGKSRELFPQILEELEEYAKFHFTFEEKVFRSSDYPTPEEHDETHREFEVKISEFLISCQSEDSNPFELINYMHEWLIQHILVHDAHYVPYLKK